MVDVDIGAGGDNARRKMDALTDSSAEIVPLELYDSSRAKIAANLQWICAKAYGIGKNNNKKFPLKHYYFIPFLFRSPPRLLLTPPLYAFSPNGF